MNQHLVAACRFFTVEQALAWTAAAYFGASRALAPPKGEPWFLEGVAWAGPDDFERHFLQGFNDRLTLAAMAFGLERVRPRFTRHLMKEFPGLVLNALPVSGKAGNNASAEGVQGV